MKSAIATSFLASFLVLSIGSGCAAEPEETEERGETASELSCQVVGSQVVCSGSRGTTKGTSSCNINGRKAVCEGGGCRAVNGKPGEGCRYVDEDGAADADDAAPGNGTSTCKVNGRQMVCEGGGCRLSNNQPGAGCRWLDEGEGDGDGDGDGDAAPAPAPAEGGNATCRINGRKAVCENGNCIAVNGQPGPGCRFIE